MAVKPLVKPTLTAEPSCYETLFNAVGRVTTKGVRKISGMYSCAVRHYRLVKKHTIKYFSYRRYETKCKRMLRTYGAHLNSKLIFLPIQRPYGAILNLPNSYGVHHDHLYNIALLITCHDLTKNCIRAANRTN